RLNNEQPLVPESKTTSVSSSSAPPRSQVKDLTSTLISANLNALPNTQNLSNFNSAPVFPSSPINRPTNSQFSLPSNNSKPMLSALDSLVIPDLSQRTAVQSLNAMKNAGSLNTARSMAGASPSSSNINAFNSTVMSNNYG